jgi:CspA family cold shock protein
MATGVVISFDDNNGYGFIQMDDGDTAFVHHSSIEMEGFRTLKPGDQVSFDVLVGKRGVEAKHVSKIP